jgi:hypothetical protein
LKASIWRGSAAALMLTAVLAAPSAANAETRTATLQDPDDGPTVLLDVEQVRVNFNRDAGQLTVTTRLHRPWPQVTPETTGSLTLRIGSSDPDSCSTDTATGETYISFDKGYDTNEWQAVYNVNFNQDYPSAPVTFSADRREATIGISNPQLVGADLKCLTGSSYGRGSYDASQPDGGPTSDSLDGVWFDGYAPAAPVPPGQTGNPGQSAPGCDESAVTVAGPPRRVVSGRNVSVSWRGGENDDVSSKIVGATLTQTPDGGAPRSRTFSGRGSATIRPTFSTSPLRVNLRWTELNENQLDYSDSTCSGERNWTVRAVRGDKPRIHVAAGPGTRSLYFDPPDSCAATRKKPITITVKRAGRARRAGLGWACGSFSRRAGRLPGLWTSVGSGGGTKAAHMQLEAGSYGNYRRSFAITVRGAGRTWRRHAVVTSRHTPARRIYWESDAYINYCINELKETYSSNGRLYCIKPGSNHQSIRIAR